MGGGLLQMWPPSTPPSWLDNHHQIFYLIITSTVHIFSINYYKIICVLLLNSGAHVDQLRIVVHSLLAIQENIGGGLTL